uniref:Transmembrane protein n=1 Tax=Proboscia inermis TaxID=420281 RepID=A0A7S0CBV8_9STRA|mmetsp:Transcript_37700/g.38064  ORF Transcript_37700/g.38064 Transcript_37700/m.38064 type:complete len:122 (+) Transcript_37700:27-392(+)
MMRLTTSITTCVAIVFLLTYQPHRSIKVCHAQSRIAWPLKRNPFKKSNKTNHRLVVSAEEEIPSKGRRGEWKKWAKNNRAYLYGAYSLLAVAFMTWCMSTEDKDGKSIAQFANRTNNNTRE